MNNLFTEIIAGLDDAIAHAKDEPEPSKVVEHKPLPTSNAEQWSLSKNLLHSLFDRHRLINNSS